MKQIYFVHGVDSNEVADEALFTVGYFSTEKLATKAAEDRVKDTGLKFEWVEDCVSDETPYLVKTLQDEDEDVNVFVEAFPLDKQL